ncbi:2-oxoglutarate-dependent dioxygenase DAO-like [Pyrus ussuriensis x Pyrus communis]|uniref:2-oxoglutarate-dependent dioxygenase DAO-like n=1 Tax=Pyrus ussuriensis x Pyrus communis TaxID=2448454 RepID=A0A5N5I533_9ROSA|nr:2-oxoglutarate-dependent dioxygenase DAO-like [Pyrus ussuriensis x Pyrus communis]
MEIREERKRVGGVNTQLKQTYIEFDVGWKVWCTRVVLKNINGRLCNVKHRVQSREATIRISIATFLLGPKEEALVKAPPEFVDSEHPRLCVPFTYEDYRKLILSTKLHAGEVLALMRTPS